MKRFAAYPIKYDVLANRRQFDFQTELAETDDVAEAVAEARKHDGAHPHGVGVVDRHTGTWWPALWPVLPAPDRC